MANILLGWARENRDTNIAKDCIWLYFETETTLIKTIATRSYTAPEDNFFVRQLQDVVTGDRTFWTNKELFDELTARRSEGSTLKKYFISVDYRGTTYCDANPGDCVDYEIFHYECVGTDVIEYFLPTNYSVLPDGTYPSKWYRGGDAEFTNVGTQISTEPKYATVCDVCQNDLKIDSIDIVVNGAVYDITVNATTSDGGIEYRIGDTWQTDNTFSFSIPSTTEEYRLYIRDDLGCSNTYRDIELKPSTEYLVKYRSDFKDFDDRDWRCDIELKGYVGAVTDLIPTESPLSISRGNRSGDKFSIIRGSEARMGVVSETDFALVELFSAKDKEWRLKVYRDDDGGTPELYWTGFIATEDYQETYKRAPYDVSISFYDGLGRLKNYDYINNIELNHSRRSAINIIAECLRTTGLELDIDVYTKVFSSTDGSANHIYPLQAYLANTESFVDGDQSDTVYKVLEKILKVQKAKVYQEYGKWKIIDRDQSSNYHITTYDEYGVPIETGRDYYNGGFDIALGGQYGTGSGKLTQLAADYAVVGDYIGEDNKTYNGSRSTVSWLDFETGRLTVGKKYYVSCYLYLNISSSSDLVIGLEDFYNTTDTSTEITFNSFFDGSATLYNDRWQKLEITFTATSANIYTRAYIDGADTGNYDFYFDAIEFGEYIEPQKTIDDTTYKWLANPNMSFIPAWQKMTLKQALKRRRGVVRNGDFELETDSGFLNWRNPNDIIQKVSIPKNKTLEPAMKITGDGDNSPAFKVSSEEFRFNVSSGGVKFKLELDYRGTGGGQRIFKIAVIAGPNYLNSDGRWLSDETFITETIVADDQITRTIEINTDTIGSSASIYIDIYQTYENDGGVIIEGVSLVPSIDDIIPKEQTLEFINDDNYIHKPEEYKLDFGDTYLMSNPQVLFKNNLFTNASSESVVSGWKLGVGGDETTLGDLIGGAIYNNYSVPTKQLTGKLRGYVELGDILIENSEAYFINSDVYNVRNKEHQLEIYQTFGNVVETNYFEYYEDGTLVELENGDLGLLES